MCASPTDHPKVMTIASWHFCQPLLSTHSAFLSFSLVILSSKYPLIFALQINSLPSDMSISRFLLRVRENSWICKISCCFQKQKIKKSFLFLDNFLLGDIYSRNFQIHTIGPGHLQYDSFSAVHIQLGLQTKPFMCDVLESNKHWQNLMRNWKLVYSLHHFMSWLTSKYLLLRHQNKSSSN